MLNLLSLSLIVILFFTSSCIGANPEDQKVYLSTEETEHIIKNINSSLLDYRNLFDLLKNSSKDLTEKQKLSFYRNELESNKIITFRVNSNDLKFIKSLDWNIQYIAFENWTKLTEALILSQKIQILKQEIELKKLIGERVTEKTLSELTKLEEIFINEYSKEENYID